MPKRVITSILVLLAVVLPAGGVYALIRSGEIPDIRAELSVSDALSVGSVEGFARAVGTREFSFPDDHGPHPEYKIEWWYYTGNLDSTEGRHFGFQLTFFRIALAPEPAERESAWAASNVYTAHFALTDVEGNRFYSFERFSRDGLSLAGAEAQPFRVWLESWSAEGSDGDMFPMRLQVAEGEIAIDLTLENAKPLVLHGNGGLSQKSAGAGNASYYYSMTRLLTSGTVRIGEKSFEVGGVSWMDREWSSAALSDEQVGWDWFALQLSDGREIMFYQLRLRDGSIDPFSAGTLINADGSTQALSLDDVQIEVLDNWKSGIDGTAYPSRWRVRIPSASLDLEVTPYIKNQEMDVSVRYWEGAVRIRGTSDGEPISGNGYVELTGYNDARSGRS